MTEAPITSSLVVVLSIGLSPFRCFQDEAIIRQLPSSRGPARPYSAPETRKKQVEVEMDTLAEEPGVKIVTR